MTEILKKFTLLKPAAGLDPAAFSHHWRNIHGPLVAGIPEFWRHYTRYVQNHVRISKNPSAPAPAYAGVAEMWERQLTEPPLHFHQEPVHRERVRPDELRFSDLGGAAMLFARQHVVLDGPPGKLKIMTFLRRKAGTTPEQFSEHWRERHAPVVASVEGFWKHVRRYVQNHAVPGSTRGYAGGIDGVVELWFDGMEEYKQAIAAPGLPAVLEDEKRFIEHPSLRLVVEELPFSPPL